jgi:hypothetical protein
VEIQQITFLKTTKGNSVEIVLPLLKILYEYYKCICSGKMINRENSLISS